MDNSETGCMMQARTLTGHREALRKPENDNQSMVATLRTTEFTHRSRLEGHRATG